MSSNQQPTDANKPTPIHHEENFWTPERNAAMKPRVPKQDAGSVCANDTSELTVVNHTENFWTPERDAAMKPRVASKDAGSVLETDKTEAAGLGSALGYPVPDPTAVPYRYAGLLKFSIAQEPYSGSAFLINDTTILTAAHNLWEVGEPAAENFVWIPAYSPNTTPPFGEFKGLTMKAAPQWNGKGESRAWDYAVIVLDKNGAGVNAVTALGGKCSLSGADPTGKFFTEVGYQGRAYPMQMAPGPFVGKVNHYTGVLVKKDGAIPQGASGGPWFLTDGTVSSVANGLTAEGSSTKEYSPLVDGTMTSFVASNSH